MHRLKRSVPSPSLLSSLQNQLALPVGFPLLPGMAGAAYQGLMVMANPSGGGVSKCTGARALLSPPALLFSN